jgi:hypothetical protein
MELKAIPIVLRSVLYRDTPRRSEVNNCEEIDGSRLRRDDSLQRDVVIGVSIDAFDNGCENVALRLRPCSVIFVVANADALVSLG